MREQKNKNIVAVMIGFGLIVIIAVITIFKPFSHSKNDSSQTSSLQSSRSKSAVKQISPNDLVKKIHSKEPTGIIDTRSSDEFKKEHILDSQNFPADTFDFSSASLDKNKSYVIVDDGNENAGLALAGKLILQEFKNIYYLTGGFLAWKNSVNPTFSAGDPNSFTDQAKVTYIASDQLNELTKTQTNLYIIDVRKNEAFLQGHLKDANNIFLDDLEKKYRTIPIGKKIIVYDTDGLWAFQAAVRLFDLNIFNVSALSDGFKTWTQKGYAIVK